MFRTNLRTFLKEILSILKKHLKNLGIVPITPLICTKITLAIEEQTTLQS